MKPDSDSSKDIKSTPASSPGVASRLKNNFSFSNVVLIFKDQIEDAEESGRSKIAQLFSIIWTMIKESRNPWYYWYTGSKIVAIQAWIVSFLIMFSFAIIATGGVVRAFIYVLIGVALESLALIVLPILLLIDYYMIFPDYFYPLFIIPVLISASFALIINRVSVFIVFHSRDE